MSETGELLANADVIGAAGITYRQLHHWTVQGYLVPAGGTGKGSGYAREWTRGELAVACLMGRLTAAGLPPAIAARVARCGQERCEIAPGVTVEVTGAAG